MEENNTKFSANSSLRSVVQIAIVGAEEIHLTNFDQCKFLFLNSVSEVIAHANSVDIFILNTLNNHDQKILIYLQQNDIPFITIDGDLNHAVLETLATNIAKTRTLGFLDSDFVHIYNYGISIDAISNHINFFEKGLKKKALKRAAIIGDGILILDQKQISAYADKFGILQEKYICQKFVPASGAASRMFSFLAKFQADFNPDQDSIEKYIDDNEAEDLREFIANSDKFPFFEQINKTIHQNNPDCQNWSNSKKYFHFVKIMLDEGELNFACKPKGVVPFHQYEKSIATPAEEHIKEAFEYAFSENLARLHFTVSEEHKVMFEEIIQNFESESQNRLLVEYSFQDKSTDTIAVDLDNKPFRNGNNQLLFRPSGHGALISNLNNLTADVIFIKNIDNVSCGDTKEVALYKKALAGILLDLQSKVFVILNQIENNELTADLIPNIVSFLSNDLNIHLPNGFSEMNFNNQKNIIGEALTRPIRVCGMVKNQGEAGGGPFWIEGDYGISLQIVETSQIDLENEQQSEILKSATHFNPVDIVCGIKNHKGEKYNLHDFVDHKSGFIVHKNHEGTDIKAYELPGLWNGAMARWISVFVEVPLCTFNPVKTVNDLLKPGHQPQSWK